MFPKPLHIIQQEYKQREKEGKKNNTFISPTIKSHIKPFSKINDKKSEKKNGK
tara:strand:+ start:821 stop:979 length:159 start_codon:yes stop_codon:yes gene_type:complete